MSYVSPGPGGPWQVIWTCVQKGRQLSSLHWICLLHSYYAQGKNKIYLAREDHKWVGTRYENFSLKKLKFLGWGQGEAGRDQKQKETRFNMIPKGNSWRKPKRINMTNSQQMPDASVIISCNNINYKASNSLLNSNYIKRDNYIKRNKWKAGLAKIYRRKKKLGFLQTTIFACTNTAKQKLNNFCHIYLYQRN